MGSYTIGNISSPSVALSTLTDIKCNQRKLFISEGQQSILTNAAKAKNKEDYALPTIISAKKQ